MSKLTQYWQCPQCKMEIVTHVKLICEPTCNNPESHSARNIQMEQVKKLTNA